MRAKEEVKVELCRGARAVRACDGQPAFGVGDIFRVPDDGLVRIHCIMESGDAFYRPLTISQRIGYYFRRVFG